MTKYLTATLVALVASAAAFAGTFVVPPNATVTGSSDGTISWSGVTLGSVVHYRDVNAAPVEMKVSGSSGRVRLEDVSGVGGRFQLRDANGNYAWLTPQGTRFNLTGARLECSHPDGCALEIDGTGPKSAPVANYPGGVYQGYTPTQLSGASVTPVAMVSSPTVVGASQSPNAWKYKLVPSEAKKADYKKPVTKAKAKVKAASAKDCGGLPVMVGGQLVQKPCEAIYLGVPTPQVVAAAPAAPAVKK